MHSKHIPLIAHIIDNIVSPHERKRKEEKRMKKELKGNGG